MKTTHLSDKEIQQYTFDINKCESIIIEHIEACELCKNVADSYQLLSKTLTEQPRPYLDYNLAERVLVKLPSKNRKPLPDYTIISALIILCFGIIAIVLDSFKNSLINFGEIKNLTSYFIVSVGVFIALLSSLDMIKSFNRKINNINFS